RVAHVRLSNFPSPVAPPHVPRATAPALLNTDTHRATRPEPAGSSGHHVRYWTRTYRNRQRGPDLYAGHDMPPLRVLRCPIARHGPPCPRTAKLGNNATATARTNRPGEVARTTRVAGRDRGGRAPRADHGEHDQPARLGGRRGLPARGQGPGLARR